MSRQPALVLSKLVGCTQEQPVHAAHTTAHLRRRRQLQNARPHHHADHVRRARHHQRGAAQPEVPAQPKHHRRRTKHTHTNQHRPPCTPLQRHRQQRQRNRQRTQARHRPQHTQPVRARVQHIHRKDRHQRNRATQQHRKKIQRHRPQQQPRSGHILQPRQHRLHREAFFLRRGSRLDQRKQHHIDQQHRQREAVNQRRSIQPRKPPAKQSAQRDRKQKPTHHRPTGIRNLKDRRTPRHRIDEVFLRHQRRHQRTHRRPTKTSPRTNQKQNPINQPDVMRPTQRNHQQQRRRNRLHRVADQHHRPPVIAIRHMPRHQHKEDPRQKQSQPGVPQHQRRVRNLIHLPRHTHGLRFAAHYPKQPRRRIKPEVPRLPRYRSRCLFTFPVRHSLYAYTNPPMLPHRRRPTASCGQDERHTPAPQCLSPSRDSPKP